MLVKRISSTDPRLGRQIVHDERSRSFVLDQPSLIDPSAWRDKSVRIYDPTPNPNQVIGNCTGCSKANMLNAVGNRRVGRVLGMRAANDVYSLATSLDPWDGSWPPEDTGSSGLAAAKAAQKLGYAGEYRWIFTGINGVVQAIQDGAAVSMGTYWYNDMFDGGIVTPTGGVAGGHQWTAHRYDKKSDLVGGVCWWGSFREFWISRSHLDLLLRDDGDAHVQKSL